MDQEKVLNIAKDYADSVRKVVDTADVFLYGSMRGERPPRTATSTSPLLCGSCRRIICILWQRFGS